MELKRIVRLRKRRVEYTATYRTEREDTVANSDLLTFQFAIRTFRRVSNARDLQRGASRVFVGGNGASNKSECNVISDVICRAREEKYIYLLLENNCFTKKINNLRAR